MAFKSTRSPKKPSHKSTVAHSGDLLLEGSGLMDPSAVGTWTPYVDICHKEDRVLVRVELPGVDPSDVSLSFRRGVLSIRGIKREQTQPGKLLCYYCLERRYGKFDRNIPIRWVVDPLRALASFDKGILTIELPKLTERRGNLVEIRIEQQ